ncbi:MAG: glycosyltransferase family 9 protein [Pseudomonadota bacterium]
MKKIGILQTAFLGDAVLVAAMVDKIHEFYGSDAEIHLILRKNIEPIFENDPRIASIIAFDKRARDKGVLGMVHVISATRKLGLDVILSVHRSLRSSVIARLSGARKVIGFKEAILSSLFSKTVKRNSQEHEVQRNHLLLEALDDKFKKIQPNIKKPYTLYPPETTYRRDLDELEKNTYIVIAPGSKWHTKRWTKDGYINIISRIIKNYAYKVILTGDKNDIKFSDDIASGVGATKRVMDFAGKLNIPDLFYLISKARLVITNDSAPQHIAVGLGVPVVSIFGPTTKKLGYYPYFDKAIVVEAENVECRPCGLHGHMNCPKKTHRCMDDILPEDVMEAVIKLL